MWETRGVYRDLVGKPRERDQWRGPGVDGRRILRLDIQEVECRVMGWIELAQDRGSWRAM
jgi:hypothetical protein